MSDINIDKLMIEVESSTDKAEKTLDRLISKLEKLQSTVQKCTGMTKIANQINKITTAINNASGIEKIERLCSSLGKLQNIKAPNVTKTVNAIKKLNEACNSVGGLSNISQFTENIRQITEACKPMENMGKNTLAPFLNSLKKLPEITNSLDTNTLTQFAEKIRQITAAITPLTTAVSNSQAGLVSLNNIIRATTASNGNLAASNAATTRSFTSLGGIINSVKLKFAAVYIVARKIGSVFTECLDSSNAYVENLNLFYVSMGDAAESALEYAKKVNKLLGIDVSDWIRNQGVFKQITSGFGVITEKANLMSKNLTQIGYDIASFFNISVEDAMQKVQSGISGELEPLRRLGYALDAATLQQIAYNNGITQNINTMTQAQKSQLRYIAILQQSTNVMGDMARTIVTPANSMRILNQQIEQMKRAFGNVISVIAVKVIPYLQVAVRLLTELGNYLANKMGFELPTIDYSGVSDGISSVTDSADEATEAVSETAKEIQRLAGFDEINVLQSNKDDNSNSNTNAANNFDLGIELPEYDFLKDLNEQTDDLYKKVKKKLQDLWKWWEKHRSTIKKIAAILGTIWALTKIKKFIDKVKELWVWFNEFSIIKTAKKWLGYFLDGFKNSTAETFFGKLKDGLGGIHDSLSLIQKIGIGTVFGTIAGISSYDFFKKLSDGTLTWKEALKDSAIFLGAIGAAFALGGPLAGGIAIIGGLVGAMAGLSKPIKTMSEILGDDYLFDNGGVKVSNLTDMFKEQYDEIIKTNEKMEEYQGIISDNKDKISDAIKKIEDFNTAFGDTKHQMSEDDLNKIKSDFETISEAIKENVGTATQGILDAFSKKIEQVADDIGVDLDNVIGSLKGFASEMSSNVDKANTTVTDYWQMIYDGITPTASQKAEYEKANGYLTDKMRSENEELSKAKKKMQEAIDLSKVDFQSPEGFEQSMSELTEGTQNALSAVESTYYDGMSMIEDLYKEAQLQYKYGIINDSQFKLAQQTYEDTRRLLKADLEQSKNDIQNDYATLTGFIQNQLDDTKQEFVDYYTAVQVGIIKYGEKISKEEINSAKKYWGAYWDELATEQKKNVDYNFRYYQDIIQSSADAVEIKPDKQKGKEWVEGTICDGIELALPSVQSEIKSTWNLAREISLLSMNSTLDALGIKTSDKLRSNATKNFYDYNAAINSETDNLYSNLDSVPNTIKNKLNIDLSKQGENTAKTFTNEMGKGLTSGYNSILETSKSFYIQMINTFNDVAPYIKLAFSTISPDLASKIDIISYTATGRYVSYDGFANGGFPKKYQLFAARENGIPEMVGKIGNQTAVANNSQIEEGIARAVYKAMTEANANGESGNIYVTVPTYVDGDMVNESQYKYNQRQLMRSNGRR